MKLYCNSKSINYSVLKNMCRHHSFVDNEKDADFSFSLQHPKEVTWLEYNKLTAYNFFKRNGINIPEFKSSEESKSFGSPFVMKFLCGDTIGTQTVVVNDSFNLEIFHSALQKYKDKDWIVQRYITGHEYTVTVLVGSRNWITIGSAKDYKTLYENSGPNTFGLGSVSFWDINSKCYDTIDKVIFSLRKEGYDYRGFLSFQFIENEIDVFLLECNIRLCMPEFQSMSKNIDESIFDRLYECYNDLAISDIKINNLNSATVVLIDKEFPNCGDVHVQFPKTNLEIITDISGGKWCNNTFIASINNHGDKPVLSLTNEIYDYLNTFDTSLCHYRRDIGMGKWRNW